MAGSSRPEHCGLGMGVTPELLLEKPELEETPELDTPELESPELEVPELDSLPELDPPPDPGPGFTAPPHPRAERAPRATQARETEKRVGLRMGGQPSTARASPEQAQSASGPAHALDILAVPRDRGRARLRRARRRDPG